MRAWLALLAAVAGLGVLGCGGPSFDGRVYRGGDMAFRLGQLPESWRRIEADGALLAFRDDQQNATVAVNGRCGVDGDDVPLTALTHHLFLHFTRRKVLSQTAIELDGRAALRTELSAELDGVIKEFWVYVLKKDGCVYDFMWIGPPDNAVEAEQAFHHFVTGFSTEI